MKRFLALVFASLLTLSTALAGDTGSPGVVGDTGNPGITGDTGSPGVAQEAPTYSLPLSVEIATTILPLIG